MHSKIVELGIENLWKEYLEIDEYLDDFVWFYGSASEALRYSRSLAAMGKFQWGVILLLRHYLVKDGILLIKKLSDERTMVQLRRSQVPRKLDFIEQFYKRDLDISALLHMLRKCICR